MLCQLTIQNFATVETLDIEFHAGMSVLTGETGAGKSIILGALGLTLGDRAERGVVRDGASKADISGEFDISGKPEVLAWLDQNDLLPADGDETEQGHCLFRRVINSDGRSRAYINGSVVTLSNLKTLGEMLIDIHSQHEHQSLLLRTTHLRLLDDFASNQALAASVIELWKKWQGNSQKISQLSEQSTESSAQTQLLSYQLGEIDELALGENEPALLNSEFKKLSQADDSIASYQQALTICAEGDDGAISQGLNHALALLQALPHKQERIESIITMLETASIQVEEAVSELRLEIDQFDINPQRLEQINQRLADIHNIARKHKIKADDIPVLTIDLREQLGKLINCDEDLKQMQLQDEALRAEFTMEATKLSKARHKASADLCSRVNEQLKSLGMSDARFEIAFHPVEDNKPSSRGLETIEFLVSTNLGQSAKPLIKIASGGELSRISLAIQVITARTSSTPTLVFDEVDVGIGGSVARSVGELLRQLGDAAQILCVTHQPQVAGQGHHHYVVSKKSKGDSTQTAIEQLPDDQRVAELARMLGGEVNGVNGVDGREAASNRQYSEESLAHAQQMVAKA